MIEFEHTGTNPPVAYEYSTEARGERYILYPVKGKHTEDNVKYAQKWLIYHKNVLGIQIRWRLENDEMAPPEKIPDVCIIQDLRVEIGKLKSYIQELEAKNKQDLVEEREAIQNENSKARQEAMKEDQYLRIKKENTQQKKEILKLKQNISDLIYRMNQLQVGHHST